MEELIKLIAKIENLKAIDTGDMSPSEQQRLRTRIAELEMKLAWLRKCSREVKKLAAERAIESEDYYPKPSLN